MEIETIWSLIGLFLAIGGIVVQLMASKFYGDTLEDSGKFYAIMIAGTVMTAIGAVIALLVLTSQAPANAVTLAVLARWK